MRSESEDIERRKPGTPLDKSKKIEDAELPSTSRKELDMEDPNAERTEEVLLRKQTYTSPEVEYFGESMASGSMVAKNARVGTINSSPELTSLLSGTKCLDDKNQKSNLSWDTELSSDGSENINGESDRKLKNRHRLRTDEDVEAQFRAHFIETFRDLPRISQISLDDLPNLKKKPPTSSVDKQNEEQDGISEDRGTSANQSDEIANTPEKQQKGIPEDSNTSTNPRENIERIEKTPEISQHQTDIK